MKNKKLLAIILLSLSFCFVSGTGYGEIFPQLTEEAISQGELYFKKDFPEEPIKTILTYTRREHPTYFEFYLLGARVNYMMMNPNTFVCLFADYDESGALQEIHKLPEGVVTKGKVLVTVYDRRKEFSHESGTALLELFKLILTTFYSYIDVWVTDINTDVVAKFYSKEGIPLGYSYQGEYHLWEE